MDKKLEVKNLQISFRTQGGVLKAVRNISYDLHKGETKHQQTYEYRREQDHMRIREQESLSRRQQGPYACKASGI